MGMTARVWCEDLMTRTLSSQCLHHDTLLWLINVASVYHLLTAEGSLMGTGELMSGEDCCLRQRKEKVIELRRLFVIFSGSLHSRSRSSRIHHWHTFGSHLTDRVLQYTTMTQRRTASRQSRPCCSPLSQRPSRAVLSPNHLYRALPLH